MIDDAALLRAYAGGRSESAFAEFVGRRVGFVYVAALRQVAGDAQLAEDVTQGVFVLVAKRAGALARHERLAGWLHTTTRNMAHQVWRDKRRRDVRELEAARMSEMLRNDAAGADGIGEVERLRPMLDEALGALREGEREAVLLRFFEGRGFGEIGARLKMSEDAARMRVSRGLEKMRSSLARKGVTSSAAALSAFMAAEAAQGAPAGLAASVSAGAMAAAGAAVASAGVGAILAFMSSAKITTAAIAALLVAAAGIYYGVQSERGASDALAQARLENSKLAAQLRGLERQSVGAVSATAANHDPLAAGQALLAAHPEIEEQLAAFKKSAGARMSFRFSRALNLSPEQSDKLAEIMGRGSVIGTYATKDYGLVSFRAFYLQAEENKELKNLLGDEGYEKFRYLQMLNMAGSSISRDLSSALAFTDTPLTSQQAWELDKICSDVIEAMRDTNNTEGISPEARFDLLAEQAKSVLSPEQMRAIEEISDRYVWDREFSKWYNEYEAATTQSK